MKEELVCTCWDVNAEGCEFCRLMELEAKASDYDWDNPYEDGSNERPYFDPEDDDLPF